MNLTKFKTFVRYNYGYILLLVILITVCILSFKDGFYILSNDNYSPELNTSLTLERSLVSPAWRTYRVLGFQSESEQADIFRTGIFSFMDIFLEKSSLGQVYYLVCLIVGSFFTAKLAETISRGYKDLKKYSQPIFFLSGITYISTLWTVWVFYQNMGPYITNFGFLPLLLHAIYKYLQQKSNKRALFLFISSIFFTSTSVIATLFVADLIVITIFTTFFALRKGESFKEMFKKAFSVIVIILVTQLFWILPFIFYTLNVSSDIIGSFVNRTITTSVIDLEAQMQTAINSVRLYSRILTDSDGKDLLFSMSEEYLLYDFYKVFGLIPAFFSLILIPFSIIKKNYKLLFFIVIAFITWFFIKVTNPPLGFIFTWFQDNIPLFKQVFRWPFSKLANILLISLSILSSFGVIYLSIFLSSFLRNKILKITTVVLPIFVILILQLFYAEFLFTGNLFSRVSRVNVPQEYYDLGKYLEDNDSKGRIYYAPPSNNSYFREYSWGFRGSQFVSYILPNPMMDLSLAVGSQYGESAMNEISNVYRSGDIEKFNQLMNKYEVKYLLFDESIVSEGFSFKLDDEINQVILKNFNLIWNEGSLFLYKFNDDANRSLVERYTQINTLYLQNDFFSRDKPLFPTITPLYVNLNNYVIDANDIVGELTYLGEEKTFLFTKEYSELLSYPTKIQKGENTLVLTPSYPQIREATVKTSPRKEYLVNDNYEKYIVGDSVFSLTDFESGVSLDIPYRTSTPIYGLKDSNFGNYIDMTDIFSQSTGEDCSGIQDLNYEVTITDQGIASGIGLNSESSLPCVYSKVLVSPRTDFVVKMKVNWESEENIIPGFCLYSENEGKCLNDERYIYSSDSFGEVEYTVPVLINSEEKLSLILYALDSNNRGVSNIIFRNISMSYAEISNPLPQTENVQSDLLEEISLENDKSYEVSIPLLYGDNSYSYISQKQNPFIWQPNTKETQTSETFFDNGMFQEVTDGFINQSNNLFTTNPNSRYMIFFNGINFGNIPSDICLVYEGSNECWYQDMLLDGARYSSLNFFNSNASYTNRLDVLFNSHSYKKTSKNKLEDFVIQETPSVWEGVEYIPTDRNIFAEYEMSSAGKSPHSTTYKISSNDIGFGSRLISIPQAHSNGWLGIARTDDGLKLLNDSVSIKGWKQGWDISDIQFSNIYVIYWPNLLSHIGYVLIVVTLCIILINIFKQQIRFKYGKK